MISKPSIRYSHLLFDLDNTLLDFNSASERAFKATIIKLGLNFTHKLYDNYLLVNKLLWNELELAEINKEELIHKRWTHILGNSSNSKKTKLVNQVYLDSLVDHTEMMDGALHFLNHLHSSELSLSIVTNGFKHVQYARISKMKLSKYFDRIIISEEIGFTKPDSRFFTFTLSQLNGAERDKTLIIGDNLNSDILGGINAGIDTCWFNRYRNSSENGILPNYSVSDFHEIYSIIGISAPY